MTLLSRFSFMPLQHMRILMIMTAVFFSAAAGASAFAQTANSSAAANSSANDFAFQLIPFGLVFIIMYVFILRPQQRRQKEQAEMHKTLRRGDVVVTTGGLIGKIAKATDELEVEVEIAPSVKVRLLRHMIVERRAKSEPVKPGLAKKPEEASDDKPEKDEG